MEPLLKSDIFFFISSIATIVLASLLIVVFVYVIQFFHTIHRIVKRIEITTDEISDDAKEVVERVKESYLFSVLFPQKKKRTQSRTKK
jgi:uncharacterized membrane protein